MRSYLNPDRSIANFTEGKSIGINGTSNHHKYPYFAQHFKQMKRILFLSLILNTSFSLLNSQSWTAMGTGLNGTTRSGCIYNGNVYAGGTFTTADGNPAANIARWDGAQWSALGSGTNNSVFCMCEYHGQLVVAGAFTTAGGLSARKIARWNGVTWDTLGHGINGLAVYDMKVYHDKLYVTGKFGQAGSTTVNNIAVWNDTTWADVAGGLSSVWTSPQGDALEVYNGELYVGGKFDVCGTDSIIMHLARWNGTTWNGVAEGLYYTDHVYSLENFGGNLMIGGDISSNSIASIFANNLMGWDGTSFFNTGPGVNSQIEDMYHYGNYLYIGGQFNLSGTTLINKIATWDGNTFAPMGTGCNNTVYGVVADEGIIYAFGSFSSAGSISASHAAKWSAAGVGINENAATAVNIFPNPSNSIFNFNLENLSVDEELIIYNSLGEKIKEVKIVSKNVVVDLSIEATGIYFYSISDRQNVILSGKLVRE
jgi:hypothetical protein